MFEAALLGMGLIGLLVHIFDDENDPPAETETQTEAPQAPTDIQAETSNLLLGDDTDETLIGTDADESMFGHGGNDLIEAQGGDDRVFGGADEDTIFGGTGDDLLRGGAQDDLISGGQGADEIRGDAGNDLIVSATILDDPALLAAVNNTSASVDPEITADTDVGDTVNGGVGDDTILFGNEDTVTGGTGMDIFGAGDWIAPGAPATITDYDPSEDLIAYSFDGPTPVITTAIDAAQTATVSADGVVFLVVLNAGPSFSAAEIDLENRN
jgi:Ca2+-binding RTX toxin-like protein